MNKRLLRLRGKYENERYDGIAVFDTLFTCDNLNLDVEYIGKQLVEPDYIEAATL